MPTAQLEENETQSTDSTSSKKSADANVKNVYLNEKPAKPEDTKDVAYEINTVSRTVKTVEGETKSILYVLTPVALTFDGMSAIAGGSEKDVLKHFNSGFFSSQRTKAQNELTGGSEQDRAFSKIVKAVAKLPMFSGKNEDEITETLRSNPALMQLFASQG